MNRSRGAHDETLKCDFLRALVKLLLKMKKPDELLCSNTKQNRATHSKGK